MVLIETNKYIKQVFFHSLVQKTIVGFLNEIDSKFIYIPFDKRDFLNIFYKFPLLNPRSNLENLYFKILKNKNKDYYYIINVKPTDSLKELLLIFYDLSSGQFKQIKQW